MDPKREKTKMVALIVAGAVVCLVALGSPKRTVRASNRFEAKLAEEVIARCVPDTMVQLPRLATTHLSFLCGIDLRSGKVDNFGPVRLIEPVDRDGSVSTK